MSGKPEAKEWRVRLHGGWTSWSDAPEWRLVCADTDVAKGLYLEYETRQKAEMNKHTYEGPHAYRWRRKLEGGWTNWFVSERFPEGVDIDAGDQVCALFSRQGWVNFDRSVLAGEEQ